MRALLALLSILASFPAAAQTVATSAGPDRVEVTVYRNPRRDPSTALTRSWLDGFALVTETRRVTLPAGETELRFEGVAGGILPQSAIVTGLPDGVVERNRDAYLLSPGTLVDRSLGRRVTIRRTSEATGRVSESDAVIRGTANGVVLQTPDGFEALRCTGLDETLIMSQVPPGLSVSPTLSVRTRVRAPVTATVTLSYLASGFDWQANYIVNLSGDGAHADVFAWLTLASTDETSFRQADVQAVAGQLNRGAWRRQPREGGPLNLRCWPQARTSDIPRAEFERLAERGQFGDGEDIVLTGSRIPGRLAANAPVATITAAQEELGDLKLYRIPEPVTLAANSQKQVALLHQPSVEVRFVYRQRIGGETRGPAPARRLLVTRNRTAEGLGLPLPAGRVQLFDEMGGRPILIGEGFLPDRAVGEDVEIAMGQAPGVNSRVQRVRKGNAYILTVTNDSARPVRFEAEFEIADGERVRGGGVSPRNGTPIWAVTVPANGSARLRYRRIAD